MVNTDYLRLALIKIEELEKRVENLEKILPEYEYSTLDFGYSDKNVKTLHEKEFKLNSLRAGGFSVSYDLKLSGNAVLEIYLNGIKAFSAAVSEGKNSETRFLAFKKGENAIKAVITSENGTAVSGLNLTVCGLVSYVKDSGALSRASSGGTDYVLSVGDDQTVLFSYTVQSGLVSCASLTTVSEASIGGVFGNVIYIIAVGKNKYLYIYSYNCETGGLSKTPLGINGVSSAAGYAVDGGIKIFYSRYAEIYSGTYTQDGNFLPSKTGRKGLKVYADHDVQGAVVIVDRFLNAKLVTD